MFRGGRSSATGCLGSGSRAGAEGRSRGCPRGMSHCETFERIWQRKPRGKCHKMRQELLSKFVGPKGKIKKNIWLVPGAGEGGQTLRVAQLATILSRLGITRRLSHLTKWSQLRTIPNQKGRRPVEILHARRTAPTSASSAAVRFPGVLPPSRRLRFRGAKGQEGVRWGSGVLETRRDHGDWVFSRWNVAFV